MRRLFLLLTIVLSYIDIYAQNNNDLIIEHIENMAEKSEEEIYDYSELLERYWSITENPININSDDIDILSELSMRDKLKMFETNRDFLTSMNG